MQTAEWGDNYCDEARGGYNEELVQQLFGLLTHEGVRNNMDSGLHDRVGRVIDAIEGSNNNKKVPKCAIASHLSRKKVEALASCNGEKQNSRNSSSGKNGKLLKHSRSFTLKAVNRALKNVEANNTINKTNSSKQKSRKQQSRSFVKNSQRAKVIGVEASKNSSASVSTANLTMKAHNALKPTAFKISQNVQKSVRMKTQPPNRAYETSGYENDQPSSQQQNDIRIWDLNFNASQQKNRHKFEEPQIPNIENPIQFLQQIMQKQQLIGIQQNSLQQTVNNLRASIAAEKQQLQKQNILISQYSNELNFLESDCAKMNSRWKQERRKLEDLWLQVSEYYIGGEDCE